MNPARDRFAALAALDYADIDEATTALVIAQEEYPALDVDVYLARLDELATVAQNRVPAGLAVAERMARLNEFLFVEQGFTGNGRSYYDPRNSFLNEVLDRRTGIPITLSIVYCAVGRRLGLALCGVGFPGHFLVKHVGDPEIIADPFFGKLVTVDECAARLQEVYGPKARFDHALLRPASSRDTLVHMLSNLKRVYVENGDVMRTLSCIDRILLLTPDAAAELRIAASSTASSSASARRSATSNATCTWPRRARVPRRCAPSCRRCSATPHTCSSAGENAAE